MGESQNIEWKESWRDEYLKWICGFANAQGGKIYIGKKDKSVMFAEVSAQTNQSTLSMAKILW
jgi:ATP-dependent DNA helicase RecG